MTRHEAIRHAARAAQAVLASVDKDAASAFYWTDALDLAPAVLAQFVECHPDAGARDLYHFGVRSDVRAVTWERCHPAQRAAVATFLGTYLALYRLVTADASVRGATVVPLKTRNHEVV